MSIRGTILFVLTPLLLVSMLHAQPVTRLDLRSTSVVRKNLSGERQILVADLLSAEDVAGLIAQITFAGTNQAISVDLGTVEKGENRKFLEIPLLTRPDSARVALILRGSTLFTTTVGLNPPRARKIYDVQVSHHDLGYADYYHFMRRDVREMGIEMALDFCRRTDSWDKNARFHWTVETSEPLTKFISSQPESVVQELAARIREGRIELGALHNSVSTEMMGYELMARLFYTPNRHIVDLLGTPPSKTALITDVVGFARTLPLFLKEAEIPYFYHGYNDTWNGMFPASNDPVFSWRANDGDVAKMPLFRSFPYYSPDRLTKYDLPEVARLLAKYDADPRWSYDCLIAEDSYDFSVPQFENVEGIRKWNEEFSNPVLISGTFSMFFDDIRRQAGAGKIPIYDEDAPNAWADQDGTDALLMAEARELNYELPAVENLATLAYASGGNGYPWKEIWQSYHKLLSYHEHTNGAASEENMEPVPLLKDRKAANPNYYECEQVMHKGLVKEARALAEAARTQAVDELSKLITTKQDRTIVVFNPLSFVRSDFVRLNPPSQGQWSIKDNMTGSQVPSQVLPDGALLFLAENVPSLGYRTFSLIEGQGKQSVERPDARLSAGNEIVENARYRIHIDSSTGALRSVFDRRLSIELVDQHAPYGLNQYIYQRIEDPGSRTLAAHTSSMLSASSFSGPLAAGITTRLKATGAVSLEQITILYANSDRIDMIVRIDKSPSGRLLKQTSSENKEALFYAMPFNVPGFTIRHELPGGVVEPLGNQFQGSTSNFFGIQHFTDLSNDSYGVTLSTINAPLIEYGTPRPALWLAGNDAESIMKKPERSHCYLYLMNNMFFTNIPVSQPGDATFRWSIRAHEGNWVEGKAYRFGWETSHPLQAFLVGKRRQGVLPESAHSFVSVNKENVLCSTVKPAEANGEGFVFRFFELTGVASDVRVKANVFPLIRSAEETSLIEEGRGIPVTLSGKNELLFSIRPFGVKTIRVIPAGAAIPPPTNVAAHALSDREVALAWSRPKRSDVSFYRIYRGRQRDFNPALINCIASVTAGRFIDSPVLNSGGWLDNKPEPATTYFYRIEAVGRDNRRGKLSEPVEVRTLSSTEKNSLPQKVQGLEAVNVSPVTDFNYISLLFYTNCESDVTRYRVYRGESPGFMADQSTLLLDVDARQKFLHVIPHEFARVTRELGDYTMIVVPDESVRPNKRYYYRVAAVDVAGQQGELSDEAGAISEISRLTFAGSAVFYDSARVDIGPLPAGGGQIRYTDDGSERSDQGGGDPGENP